MMASGIPPSVVISNFTLHPEMPAVRALRVVNEDRMGLLAGVGVKARVLLNFLVTNSPRKSMPHVVIKMRPGRSDELKAKLADAVAKALIDTIGVPEKALSVGIEEVEADDWIPHLYEPEIAGKVSTLYRKPGYGSLSK